MQPHPLIFSSFLDDPLSAKQTYVRHRQAKLTWECGKPGQIFELDGQFRFFKPNRFDPDPEAFAGLTVDQDGAGARFLSIKIWNFRERTLRFYFWKSEVPNSLHSTFRGKLLLVESMIHGKQIIFL